MKSAALPSYDGRCPLEHDVLFRRTIRISDPAPPIADLRPERNRGVRCSRLVGSFKCHGVLSNVGESDAKQMLRRPAMGAGEEGREIGKATRSRQLLRPESEWNNERRQSAQRSRPERALGAAQSPRKENN